jgi:hypothetical protein
VKSFCGYPSQVLHLWCKESKNAWRKLKIKNITNLVANCIGSAPVSSPTEVD